MISRSRSDNTVPAGGHLPVPEQIGRYQVIDRLAVGGMAEVFICVERQLAGLERLVVVKRILPHLAMHESFVAMFLAEARWVARINHPNVVQIHELGEEDTGTLGAVTPYLSMEYVAGCSLRDLLVAAIGAGQPLPVGVAVGLAIQACAGAHAAHELVGADGKPLGLVHRDISPHNLMVTADGHVKLLDFGIAKATEETGLDHTRTGALKGKVHYMAPEQCQQQPLDRRADVFALGVVAWELLASERLFKRHSELEAMQAIVNGELRDLRAIRTDVPPAVLAAVEKALVPKKDARFQTAEAMKRAFVDASRGLDTSAEAIAAFLRPLLGSTFEERRQAFLEAARTRTPASVSKLPRTKTGSMSSLSMSHPAAGGDSGEGDSTVVDNPHHRADQAPIKDDAHNDNDNDNDFDDLAQQETVRARGFPDLATPHTSSSPASSSSVVSSPSLPSLPGLPTKPKKPAWVLPVVVAALTCVVVTAALLLWPRWRGPPTSGTTMVLAWPPTVSPQALEDELKTLARLLEEQTHRPVSIRMSTSYDDVVSTLKSGEAGFAILPPYLFLDTRRNTPGLMPLATKMIDGSSGSDGVIVVAEGSAANDLVGLKGSTFCYPDQKSTTGWLLARATMRKQGLNPDVDLVTHISGNHTQVLKDITSGVCLAGATYSGGYLAADRAGIPVGRVRVLMVTGRSPQDMVVASPSTSKADQDLMLKALLAIDPRRSLGQDTVGTLERISGFTVPRLSEYDELAKLEAR
ncbi:MAG TPA: PhnD/SsuA/transferrin family substrate-binding protein [Myxococcota bacterium]